MTTPLERLKEDIRNCFLEEEDGKTTTSEKKYDVQVAKKNSAPCWSKFGRVVSLPDLKLVTMDVPSEDSDEMRPTGFVVCLNPLCSTVYQYTSQTGTSAMIRHECSKTKRKNATKASSSRSQDLRKLFISRNGKLPTSEKQRLVRELALWCATDIRPFEIVSGSGFRSVVQTLLDIQARYQHKIPVDDLICHPTTIARNIKGIADEKRSILTTRMKKLSQTKIWRGFTTDLWTDDINKVAYISITVHYIDEDWKMQARTLCVKPFGNIRHTAINVLNSFTETLESFGCNDFDNCIVTTDNGSNMSGSSGLETKFERLPCADHKISTVLTTVLNKTTTTCDGETSAPFYRYEDEIHDILELLENAKLLVRYFKQSELQAELDSTLKQENVTRWNSALTMLESVQKNITQITNLLAAKQQQHRVNAIYGPLLDELVRFLATFREATLDLESSSKPTLHLVVFWRYKLEIHCSPIMNDYKVTNADKTEEVIPKDSAAIVDLKSAVKRVLIEKWRLEPLHIAATYLCPLQHRRLYVRYNIARSEIQEAKATIKACMRQYAEMRGNDHTSDSSNINKAAEGETERPTKRLCGPNAVSLHDMSDDETDDMSEASNNNDETIQASITRELALYEKYRLPKSSRESGSYDVLSWWKSNETTYPLLAKVARSLLAVPASSAKSESNFSDAGNTITDKRNALGPERVDDMLFVRSNNDLQKDN